MCIYDDDLKLVDVVTGERTNQLADPAVAGDAEAGGEVVTCFCMHPNGTEVVVATQNFLLRHWRLGAEPGGNNECLRAIRGHTMPVQCMVYDPTGTLVATGSADRTVRVWDIERGYCTHHFRDHLDVVRSLLFHPGRHRSTRPVC